MSSVPAIRIRDVNRAPIHSFGKYVLYWMIAARRLHYNFALDQALQYCRTLEKPLLIFEPLRCDYRWASDRIHQLVLDGMADNARTASRYSVSYYPYVESEPGGGKGLLQALAKHACVVVTDEFPCFFLPHMVSTAADKLPVRLQTVDSNGLLPLRVAENDHPTAFAFRRLLQKTLPDHWAEIPSSNPLARSGFARHASIPVDVLQRWPLCPISSFDRTASVLAKLPIDHSVRLCDMPGGHSAGRKRLLHFLANDLQRYALHRNSPEHDVTSRLSPYLHFGHISVHEIVHELAQREGWSPERASLRTNGRRLGWWNMSPAAESFLDQAITWRELSYNFCFHRRDYDQFSALPAWAQRTLKEHARNYRPHTYDCAQFENGQTHDALWNAAQGQLLSEGRIHNYLRMLWGKKILEWSKTHLQALQTMIHLNNKYSLDGRDPNSYSGIFWVLGRCDRPWGPERAVFGTVRYMSSENTARKFPVQNYIRRYIKSAGAGRKS